jgi:hypothetical protein
MHSWAAFAFGKKNNRGNRSKFEGAVSKAARNLLYLCFPHSAHDEKAWGMRLHLPMQLFTGMVARASRSGDPLLQNPPE